MGLLYFFKNQMASTRILLAKKRETFPVHYCFIMKLKDTQMCTSTCVLKGSKSRVCHEEFSIMVKKCSPKKIKVVRKKDGLELLPSKI